MQASIGAITGKHILKYEFMIDAYKRGSCGKCFLYVEDVKVAESYTPVTEPFGFSADEGWNVGADHEIPV
jgi:arylsulfatase